MKYVLLWFNSIKHFWMLWLAIDCCKSSRSQIYTCNNIPFDIVWHLLSELSIWDMPVFSLSLFFVIFYIFLHASLCSILSITKFYKYCMWEDLNVFSDRFLDSLPEDNIWNLYKTHSTWSVYIFILWIELGKHWFDFLCL